MQKGNGEHAIDLSHSISRSGSRILLLEEEDAIISKCCIFRIPGMLKMQNEQAYTPYRFSIGPWHFGKTQMMSKAQKFKKAFLNGLILRFPDPAAKKKELEEAVKVAHSKAKECYEGQDVYELEDVFEGDQDSQEGVTDAAKGKFEEILLLDGCFIIEFLRKVAGKVPLHDNEYVLFSNGMILVIYHDLFLLENQIPWLVLELLFEWTRVPESETTLVELAIGFFGSAFSVLDQPQTLAELLSSGSKIVHLIDLARRYLCYTSNKKVDEQQSQCTNTIPSATRLKEAGVTFKKAMSGNIFDVKFHKGVLEIPPLQINPLTETIFRNLISFEQCRPFCIPKVTCYAMLLDCLVDTSDDVDLMSKAEIFDNW